MELFSIEDKTQKVIDLHSEVVQSLKLTLSKAIAAGEIIQEVKTTVGHGNFSQWLKQLPFSDRTARRYISLYENRDKVQHLTSVQDAYKAITGKTDTVSDLYEPSNDPVIIALNKLEERAWHLQFSKIALVKLMWSKEKYDFTKWLKQCWQDYESLNDYLKNHILNEITPHPDDYLEKTLFSGKHTWTDAMIYSLLAVGMQLDETTWEQYKEQYAKDLKEIDAPQESWDKFNSLCTEIAFDQTTIGEAAYNYIINIKLDAVKEDIDYLNTVFESFYFRITGRTTTIKEARTTTG